MIMMISATMPNCRERALRGNGVSVKTLGMKKGGK
jgi:hypothetical protein